MTLAQQPGGGSLSFDMLPGERRGATRTMTIYRLVQVEHDGDEGLARCRNISDTGMKLDLTMPAAVDDLVKVTFSPTFALSGRIAWIDGKDCGVAFDGRIDCADLLHRSASEAHASSAREPRLKANLPARMIVDGQNCRTIVSDISQHGMKLTHEGSLRAGLRICVVLQCGAKKAGIVRWADDKLAGMFLSEPFSVDELGSIRAL